MALRRVSVRVGTPHLRKIGPILDPAGLQACSTAEKGSSWWRFSLLWMHTVKKSSVGQLLNNKDGAHLDDADL